MTETVTVIIPTYAKLIKRYGCVDNLLESFKSLEGNDFRVIILNTTDPPDTSVEEKIRCMIDKYKEFFPIMAVSVLDVWKIHEFIEKNELELIRLRVNMKPYSNFRNFGLIVAKILKSKIVLYIDDDQIVKEPNFIQLVRDGMGEKSYGKEILGKSGYVVDKKGDYKVKPKGQEEKKRWPSVPLINKTVTELIESPHRFNKTSIAFCGLMVLSEKLYSIVPFDPFCKRGEDANYLMSCTNLKKTMIFDNQLKAIHLPPKSKGMDFFMKFRQDIYRFVYERERLDYFEDLDAADFDPYPGFFLRDDLEYRAASVCLNYAARAKKRGEHEHYKGHMRNLKILFSKAQEYAEKNAPLFFKFQKRWVKLMKLLRKDKKLFKHFNRFEYNDK